MITVELPEMIIKTDLKQFKDIEERGGLYVFYNEDTPVYIGKAHNVKTRIYEHMIGITHTSRIFGSFESVRYFYEDCPMYRDMYETYMINTIRPLFNKSKVYLYTPKYKGGMVFVKKTPRKTTTVLLFALNATKNQRKGDKIVKMPNERKVKVSISELIGNVETLKDIKAKKNGDITVNELLKILLNELNNNEIEQLAVIRKYKNGTVASGWTMTDGIEGLGMAEFLKLHIAEEVE